MQIIIHIGLLYNQVYINISFFIFRKGTLHQNISKWESKVGKAKLVQQVLFHILLLQYDPLSPSPCAHQNFLVVFAVTREEGEHGPEVGVVQLL